MAVVDVTANITVDTTWIGGNTYWIHPAAGTSISIYSNAILTLDCSAGDIVIKCMAGGSRLILGIPGNTGNIIQINSDATHRVIFTSNNDDAHGEAIAGSSGTPDSSDNPFACLALWCMGSIDLDWFECWYCEPANGAGVILITANSFPVTTNNMSITLRHGKFYYCEVLASVTSITAFIRCVPGVPSFPITTFIIDTVSFGNTCTISDDGYGYAIYIDALYHTNAVDVRNNYFGFAGVCCDAVYLYPANSGPCTSYHTFKNNLFNCMCDASRIHFQQYPPGTCYLEIMDNVISGSGTSIGKGIYVYVANPAVSGSFLGLKIHDNIFYNLGGSSDGAIFLENEKPDNLDYYEDYNCFYNTGTYYSTQELGEHDIFADPDFSNLPASATIDTDECFFPDGFAVGNLTELEKKGSNTFDNLVIDESTDTMTGYKYSGEDLITPGCYYALLTLPISAVGILFDVEPNWEPGITVDYQWFNIIGSSRTKLEQRSPLYSAPRRYIDAEFLCYKDAIDLECLIQRLSKDICYVPIYSEPVLIETAGDLFGLQTITIADASDNFNLMILGKYVCIMDIERALVGSVFEASSIAATSITLLQTIDKHFTGNRSILYPAIPALIKDRQFADISDSVSVLALSFQEQF